MKRLIHILILSLVLFRFSAFAGEVKKTGTTAAKFLSITPGAAGVGMGGAYVAAVSDVQALYWNPAGLANVQNFQVMVDHMDYFVGINYNFIGFAYNLGVNGTIGAALTALNYGDMERTTEFEPEGTGEIFSAGDYAGQISYARYITDKFSFGLSAKFIYQGIWHSNSYGFALDVGTLYDTGFRGLKLGMSISNFGTKMQISGKDLLVQTDIAPDIIGNNETINALLKTDKFDLPLLFRVGIMMDAYRTEKQYIRFAVDALHPNDNAESINVGFEYAYDRMIFVRGGYEALFLPNSIKEFSIGFGLAPKFAGKQNLTFDYVYQKLKYLDDIQKFSLILKF